MEEIAIMKLKCVELKELILTGRLTKAVQIVPISGP
jgi:hypothetical protein